MTDSHTFSWSADAGIEAMSTIAGVRFDRVFRELDAIVASYERGRPLLEDLFGPDLALGGPRWAGISYGHINCLGSELIFPEDSEVAHTPIYSSLQEGIRALRRDLDFTRQGLFPFYLNLWGELKQTFPEESIPFSGFGVEGPVTTAWLLRGHEFFMDLHDDPPAAAEYLRLVAHSAVRYQQTIARLNGSPPVSPHGGWMADDGAAMLGPDLWPQFVIPFHEIYFSGLTTGPRHAHIESLTPRHLPFLETIRLASYDPSVSPKLTPKLIRQNCSVPFSWRLNEGDLAALTPETTRAWVIDAVCTGAHGVRTGVWRNNCTPKSAANFHAFTAACKEIAPALAQGCPPTSLSIRLRSLPRNPAQPSRPNTVEPPDPSTT